MDHFRISQKFLVIAILKSKDLLLQALRWENLNVVYFCVPSIIEGMVGLVMVCDTFAEYLIMYKPHVANLKAKKKNSPIWNAKSVYNSNFCFAHVQ